MRELRDLEVPGRAIWTLEIGERVDRKMLPPIGTGCRSSWYPRYTQERAVVEREVFAGLNSAGSPGTVPEEYWRAEYELRVINQMGSPPTSWWSAT